MPVSGRLLVGEPVHHFQLNYTKPLWERFFAPFGTTPEKVFGNSIYLYRMKE